MEMDQDQDPDQDRINFVTIFQKNLADLTDVLSSDIKPDITKLNIIVADENKIINDNENFEFTEIKTELEDYDEDEFQNNINEDYFMSNEIKIEPTEIQGYNNNNNNTTEIDFEDYIKHEILDFTPNNNIECEDVVIKKEIKLELDENKIIEINNNNNKIDCNKNDNNINAINNVDLNQYNPYETPYECQYCGKYFRNRFNLIYHKRIHERDKPILTYENKNKLLPKIPPATVTTLTSNKINIDNIKEELDSDFIKDEYYNEIQSNKSNNKNQSNTIIHNYNKNSSNININSNSSNININNNINISRNININKNNSSSNVEKKKINLIITRNKTNKKIFDFGSVGSGLNDIFNMTDKIIDNSEKDTCKKDESKKDDSKKDDSKKDDSKKDDSSLKCNICSKVFGSKSGYLYHQRTKHNLEVDGSSYTCQYCKRVFGNKSHLSYHMKSCLLRIQLNEKGETDFRGLERKKIEKHAHENKKQKHHDTLFTLIKSSKIKVNPIPNNKKNENKKEKIEVKPKEMLRKVINASDNDKKNNQVQELTKLDSVNNISQPILLKTDDQKKQLIAVTIRKPQPDWFACHDYSKDPDDENKPHKCLKCWRNNIFPTSEALLLHSLEHTNKEPIKCPKCDYIFFKKDANYNRHIKQHSAKDFQCKICTKSFSQEVNLMTHERVHSGLRPYKCNYCGKGFSQQITMIRHERIHTGEHPYKCYYCDKAFKQVSNLKCHLQAHHRETNINTALKLFRECKKNELNHPHEKAKILARNLLQRCAAKKNLNNKLHNLTGNMFLNNLNKM